jgi:T-complex protein 1 subunit zeta
MSSLKSINPNSESMDKAAALFMNINAAKGLQDVMRSNLGPRGTIKMLVDGAGGNLLILLVVPTLFFTVRACLA